MTTVTCYGHDYKRMCLQSGTGRTLELPSSSLPPCLPPSLPLSLPPFRALNERRDGARPREQVYRAPAPESTDAHAHTRSEDGDESGAAVPLRKLLPRSASALRRGAAHGGPPAVEERLPADAEHHDPRLVRR